MMLLIKLMLAKLLLFFQRITLGVIAWSPLQCAIGKEKPETILLLRTSALGDFIFSVPAMVALRNHYPYANIVLLTATSPEYRKKSHPAHDSVRELPWLSFMKPSIINETICVHSFDIKALWASTRVIIGKLNPDVTIILAHPAEPGLGLLKKLVFLRFMGVKGRIYGWRTRASSKWFRQAQYMGGLFDHHVIGPLRSIAELPGMPAAKEIAITFPLHFDSTSRQWATALWESKGLNDRRVVAVAPGSMQSHKCWPLKNFVSLCEKLVMQFDVRIVVIGTMADKPLGQQLKACVGGEVINIAGDTSLSQSAAILEHCTLLVGNDGGAMHLGSAMGCPVVAIVSGIEYPDSIEPWYSKELAVRHSVPCAPCYHFTQCPLEHNKCVKDLPVLDVYKKCIQVLGN